MHTFILAARVTHFLSSEWGICPNAIFHPCARWWGHGAKTQSCCSAALKIPSTFFSWAALRTEISARYWYHPARNCIPRLFYFDNFQKKCNQICRFPTKSDNGGQDGPQLGAMAQGPGPRWAPTGGPGPKGPFPMHFQRISNTFPIIHQECIKNTSNNTSNTLPIIFQK